MNQKTMTPLKDLTLLHRFLFSEARDRINKLNDMLLEAGRIDDLKASVKDIEFQMKLLEEFGL